MIGTLKNGIPLKAPFLAAGVRANILAVVPLLILAALNYLTFRAHYSGASIFPWDFIGGYHAQSFGWYDRAGVTSPPAWFPWTNMGFPAFLALQSGSWYLPLAALGAMGVTYTLHVATVVQALHVLFGAIGAYALALRLGSRRTIALIAGIAFHFGATFYSNQEHVDIVRAAAWLPWLLFSLHPSAFRSRPFGILVAAVVLSQLLVSGYPGNVVSSVYACAAWVAVLVWNERSSPARLHYLRAVCIAVAAGTLMSMPKWLPLILNGSSGVAIEHLPTAPFVRSHLFTLLMPYQLEALPGDQTMRSLWIPLVAIWGAAFNDFRSRNFWIGGSLVVVSLLMGMVVQGGAVLGHWIPGMNVSRFPVSDWRPVLDIGLVICGARGWTLLFSQRWQAGAVVMRTVLMFLLCMFLLYKAASFGYAASAFKRPFAAVAILTALTACFPFIFMRRDPWSYLAGLLPVLLVLITALDGFSYNVKQPATWKPGWNPQLEQALLGGSFSEFMAMRPAAGEALLRRPARYVVGTTAVEAVAQRNALFYNRCWYARSFCLFGYDNLRMSIPHRTIIEALSGQGGDALLHFVTKPQQLLAAGPTGADSVPETGSDISPVVGEAQNVRASFLGYEADKVTYHVSTGHVTRFVENELWWPGWQVQACDSRRCLPMKAAASTSQGLRSWVVEPGEWTIRLTFGGPSPIPGYVCLVLGLLLAILCAFIRVKPKDGVAFDHASGARVA